MGPRCDECGCAVDAVVFEIGISARGDRGRWACRACVLDPARQIAVIDRRGDTLHGARIARELDAQSAITLHLLDAEKDGPPLPAAYTHVLAALERARRVDSDFETVLSELRERYEQAAFFGPKQMLLVQWRLSANGVTHDPGNFVVSTRSDKEIAQVRSFDNWRRKKLTPYLSYAQRSRWGF